MAITEHTKPEIYVIKEKYCVINLYWNYVIILYCRIDDIQNNSILHRGIPVAHSIYGIASTINAASYILLKGLKMVHSLNHPDTMRVCSESLSELHYCRGLEVFWRDNYTCPTLEEYKQMVKRSKDRTEP
jgi:geranylgeranyl pyrophosphate synthase